MELNKQLQQKKCLTCKKYKSRRLFYRSNIKKDGLDIYCKECIRKKRIKYYDKNQEIIRNKRKDSYKKNSIPDKNYNMAKYRKTKKELMDLLGSVCVKCGFDDIRALQIDHINGNGNKHRRIKASPYKVYEDMIKSIKNKENEYQLLCANCNLIEAIIKGFRKSIYE